MAVTPKLMVTGTLLTNALVTLYTVPDNTLGKVNEIVFTNHDTVARTATLHFIDSGGSAEDKNELIDPTGWTLAPGEVRFVGMDQVLETGDFIQSLADVTLKVSIRITGIEIT